MKLNRCLGCNQYTHIVNNETNRIFINKNLLDENSVKSSYADRNYSKIMKIVLPNEVNNSVGSRLSCSSGTFNQCFIQQED